MTDTVEELKGKIMTLMTDAHTAMKIVENVQLKLAYANNITTEQRVVLDFEYRRALKTVQRLNGIADYYLTQLVEIDTLAAASLGVRAN